MTPPFPSTSLRAVGDLRLPDRPERGAASLVSDRLVRLAMVPRLSHERSDLLTKVVNQARNGFSGEPFTEYGDTPASSRRDARFQRSRVCSRWPAGGHGVLFDLLWEPV